MVTIKKKSWPEYFKEVKSGKKKFEVRMADFQIKRGDVLILQEWNPKAKKYTGREVKRKVSFVSKYSGKNPLGKWYKKSTVEKKGFYIIQF